jgi:hypothetical protein
LVPGGHPVNYAFLGAYFFTLQMLFRRFVRRDLGPNAFVAVCLRIVLAVIAVWVAIEALYIMDPDISSGVIHVAAFAIGAFPLIVWQLVVGIVKRIPGVSVALPNLKTALPLSDLDGLSVWHEARLEEEDIENIPNMANADIVDLMLNTRFPPHRIIDWVDQAILDSAVGATGDDSAAARRALLRGHGIRTASALIEACRNGLPYGEAGDKLWAGWDADAQARVRATAAAIATYPCLPLVLTWRGLRPV